MSVYDENGNVHGGYAPTWGAVGAECTECFNTIDRVDGCRLYDFEGEYVCKSCLTKMLEAHKYARQGFCDECTRGFSDAEKAEEFVTHTVLPWGGRLLCIECIIEQLDTRDEDDEATDY